MIGGEMDGKEVLTMLFDNKTWSDIDCIDEKDYLSSEAINNSATTIPESDLNSHKIYNVSGKIIWSVVGW